MALYISLDSLHVLQWFRHCLPKREGCLLIFLQHVSCFFKKSKPIMNPTHTSKLLSVSTLNGYINLKSAPHKTNHTFFWTDAKALTAMSHNFSATAKVECACTGACKGCKTRKFWNLLYNLQKQIQQLYVSKEGRYSSLDIRFCDRRWRT